MTHETPPPKTGRGYPGPQNVERDAEICALAAEGMTFAKISGKFRSLTAERIRQIVRAGETKSRRNARIREKFAGVFTIDPPPR
jgi:hypothetical protein